MGRRSGLIAKILLSYLGFAMFGLYGCGLQSERIWSYSMMSPARSSLPLNNLLDEYCPSLNSNSARILVDTVQLAAQRHNVERELILAVITAESNCRVRARSRAGAIGLMQLMPRTARTLGVRRPYRSRDNVFGGTKYLAYLLNEFDSDLELALAAYNAGPNRVKRVGRVPPIRATKKYIKKVINYYHLYHSARW